MKEERSASRATDEGKAPAVSVIVPVYNVEKYLRQCLDSILAQTFTDFELLLIDDGSPDTSGAICDEYASRDPRVRVFHKENGGVSSARNLGIDESKGELICFVDSDDWVEANYCQTIVDNIGDADVMYFSEVWHYKDGCIRVFSAGESYHKNQLDIEKDILHMLDNKPKPSHNYLGYTWNKVFRSNIIAKNKIRFVEGLSVSEDEIYTWEYLLHSNTLKTIYAPIYNYRYFNSGLTNAPKDAGARFSLAKMLYDFNKRLEYEPLRACNKRRIQGLINSGILTDNPWHRWLPAACQGAALCRSLGVAFPYRGFTKLLLRTMLGLTKAKDE